MEREADFAPSDIFHEVHPKIMLPNLYWLQITGIPREQDFGIEEKTKLIVSTKARTLIELGSHEGVTFSTSVPSAEEITASSWENATKTVQKLRKLRDQN
jgi:hypothetical protein